MSAYYKGLPRMLGRPPGWDDSEEGSYLAYRRAAATMLLSGYVAAVDGDKLAIEWVNGWQACLLADLLGLPYWPPKPEQFYSLPELEQRAAALGQPAHFSMRKVKPKYQPTPKMRRDEANARIAALFANLDRVTVTPAATHTLSLWSYALSWAEPVQVVMASGPPSRAPVGETV